MERGKYTGGLPGWIGRSVYRKPGPGNPGGSAEQAAEKALARDFRGHRHGDLDGFDVVGVVPFDVVHQPGSQQGDQRAGNLLTQFETLLKIADLAFEEVVDLFVGVEERVAGLLLEIFLEGEMGEDRKSTRLNSSHVKISYAVFC